MRAFPPLCFRGKPMVNEIVDGFEISEYWLYGTADASRLARAAAQIRFKGGYNAVYNKLR
jgi:hypothetical protein